MAPVNEGGRFGPRELWSSSSCVIGLGPILSEEIIVVAAVGSWVVKFVLCLPFSDLRFEPHLSLLCIP